MTLWSSWTRRATQRSPQRPCAAGRRPSGRYANQDSPGHWKGDLIIGARNQSAALTLVGRSTNFQIVYAFPNGNQDGRVIDRLVRWVQTTRTETCESLTWDRGSEMAHSEVLTNGWCCPCSSAILTHRGSDRRTRTPTGNYVSGSPKASTSAPTARPTTTKLAPFPTVSHAANTTFNQPTNDTLTPLRA